MDLDHEQARKSFGKAVLGARHRKGWSQEYLGAQMEVSQATVAQWERGGTVPDHMTMFKLERILGLRQSALSQFFGYEPLNMRRGKERADVIEAILKDDTLNDEQRDVMLAAYSTFTGSGAKRS